MAKTLALKARPAAKGREQRKGQRPNNRRYPPDGQEWGSVGWPDLVDDAPMATGATAGTPGTWTPTGATPPTTVANLINGVPRTVVPSPSTPWTGLQFVQTGTAGAAGEATWTGTAWVGGKAPATMFDPTGKTIIEVQDHVLALTGTDEERRVAIQAILDIERANQNRVTLVNWLDGQLGVI